MQSIFMQPARCVACRSCEIACAVHRSSLSRRLPEAMSETPAPLARVRVEEAAGGGFPVQCRHCEDAPCLDACPSRAIFRDSEGLVLVEDERCIGCWMCVMVCPFGAPQPFREHRKMLKCDRCVGMDAPYCVESCPTQALVLLDPADVARGARTPARPEALVGLDFRSPQTLAQP